VLLKAGVASRPCNAARSDHKRRDRMLPVSGVAPILPSKEDSGVLFRSMSDLAACALTPSFERLFRDKMRIDPAQRVLADGFGWMPHHRLSAKATEVSPPEMVCRFRRFRDYDAWVTVGAHQARWGGRQLRAGTGSCRQEPACEPHP
jgi:hypothetical protein